VERAGLAAAQRRRDRLGDVGEEVLLVGGEAGRRPAPPQFQEPQQPNRSRNTSDATSPTPCGASSCDQTRLRDGSSPLARRSSATPLGPIVVHRLSGVRYFSLISRGSWGSSAAGTSARGAQPTVVCGSVNTNAYQSNPTTRRSSSMSRSRSVSGSPPAAQTCPTRSRERTFAAGVATSQV
jgi:hypothetical protein